MKSSLLQRACVGLPLFGVSTAALIFLFPYDEQFAKRADGLRATVHLEPVELPVIEPLPLEKLERIAYINIELAALARCKADGGEALVWNCIDCIMRCFGKSKCDTSGCYEGPELWTAGSP